MEGSKSNNKLKIAIILITIISKILGFSRDLVLSYYYGATNISDAYLIATTLPVTLFAFVGTAITSSYIPTITDIKEDKDKNKFNSLLFTILISVCLFIVVIVNLFPSYVIKLFASGFDGDVLELSVSILRVNIFNVLFSGIIFLFVAFLNYKQKFLVTVARSIPFDISIICSIILSYYTNSIDILSYGLIISIVFEFLFILPSVIKNKYKLEKFSKSDFNYVKNMLIIALPAILSSALNEINAVIDRSIASNIAEGAVSALTYASRILSAIISIFITSLITIVYPKLVENYSRGDNDTYIENITKTTNDINFFTVPLFAGFMILSSNLINVLFGRGNFSVEAENLTSNTFLMYAISIFFCGLRELYTMVFYSQKKIKIPILISIISLLLNIILNFILAKFIGVPGLALATSISTIVSAVIMLCIVLKFKLINYKSIFINFIKVFTSAILMSIVLLLGKLFLPQIISNNILILVTCVLLGFMVYLVSNILLKTEFIIPYINWFKKKIKKGENNS